MYRLTCSDLEESSGRRAGAAGWSCVVLDLRRRRLAVTRLPLIESRAGCSVSTSTIGSVVDELGRVTVVKEGWACQLSAHGEYNQR
ncbi:hypothetical protein NDU88_002692 [Pleurodeles waltl]|uniref:Uncharacterized protein n=1 Tax=Pleurodeles waltl TaxID=8319 RepID=A0AAV7VC07_PLEWA|nr:hypothetical protein NDU88_002692 [Pleurodeles waltl]